MRQNNLNEGLYEGELTEKLKTTGSFAASENSVNFLVKTAPVVRPFFTDSIHNF